MRHAATRLAALIAMLASGLAGAGSFGVSPIRVDLDRATRSAVVEVSNDDQRKLSFQVKLMEWTQDAAGQDQYAESQDLIFFPPLFTVNPGEKRILRVGAKPGGAPGPREKTYRLFIEELPPPAPPGAGAQLRIALRFALPIFVAPVAPQKRPAIDLVRNGAGKVTVRLGNQGNQSYKVESLRLRRGTDTVGEAQGWYVLAGASRDFDVPVEAAKCPLAGTVELEAQSEGVVLARQSLEATASLCQRP
jgi:fimbrial chaperone protein